MKIDNGNGLKMRISNQHELKAAQHLIRNGYTVYKRGWPDFLAIKGNEIRFIEVKPHPAYNFTKVQKSVAEILKKASGRDVELWPRGTPVHNP